MQSCLQETILEDVQCSLARSAGEDNLRERSSSKICSGSLRDVVHVQLQQRFTVHPTVLYERLQARAFVPVVLGNILQVVGELLLLRLHAHT